MASNNSSQIITQFSYSDLMAFTMYLIEGIPLLCGNMVLLVIIIKYEALRTRKEFVIIGALALADALSTGVANIFGAIYRIPIVMNMKTGDEEFRSTCIRTVHARLWSFSQPCAALMLLVVSIDRFISIRFPLQYIGYSTKYAFCMVGVPYSISLIESATMIYRAWDSKDLVVVGKRCFTFQSVLPADYRLFLNQNTISTLLSIVVYLFTIIEVKRSFNKVFSTGTLTSNQIQQQQQQSLLWQKRFTTTMGLSCLCTLIFYCMPTIFRTVITHFPNIFVKLGSWAWVIQCINPICNLIIYGTKQNDIKKGFRALIKCKQMPISLQMWQQIA